MFLFGNERGLGIIHNVPVCDGLDKLRIFTVFYLYQGHHFVFALLIRFRLRQNGNVTVISETFEKFDGY